MSNPLISIIAPVYKVQEQYLRDCIVSLQNQTYSNIEIILVDDGSPDNCGLVCDEFAKKDNRIKVIHKPNGGLVSARNAGYEIATGDWFCFMDSDDWLDVDMMEKIVHQLDTHTDIDVVFWKLVHEVNGQQITGKLEWKCNDYTHVYGPDECKQLAVDTLIYNLGVSSPVIRLVRMDFAKKNNVTHDSRTKQGLEGNIFAMRSFYYAQKALFINEYFYHYRYNPTSISKSVSEANVKCIIDCLKVMEEDISTFSNKEDFRKPMYDKAIYVILAMAMNTYFHPANTDSLVKRTTKFARIIDENLLFKEAIRNASYNEVDKFRKIALFFIKIKMYFILDVFGKAKQFMLKRGKYNY